jgi:hypothetical protein
MTEAKRLTKFGLQFRGPLTPESFRACYVEPSHQYDHVVVGSGESRGVAVHRALSHMSDLRVDNVMDDIVAQAMCVAPANCHEAVPGAKHRGVGIYCIIGIDVERDA